VLQVPLLEIKEQVFLKLSTLLVKEIKKRTEKTFTKHTSVKQNTLVGISVTTFVFLDKGA
jgi:hypothetical protein